MEFTFFIPHVLPGLNEIIDAAKRGRGAGNYYRKLKADWGLLIFVAIKNAKVPAFTGPVHIHFQWIEPNKRRDPDNVAAGKKLAIDSLRHAGILGGDGWKHIVGLSETFSVNAANPGVILTISDAMRE